MNRKPYLATVLLLCVSPAYTDELPDLTGFYTSPMSFGPPQILGPDGVTFVDNPAPPFGDDPYTRMNCIPDTAFGYNPYGEQLVQTPGRLTWINQYNQIVRRIDITDGKQSMPENIKPSFTGYSLGHWEDDVLVVETTALRTIQVRGAPDWSRVERIEERIRSLEDGAKLERITRFEAVTPEGKADTMTTRIVYQREPGEHLFEFICEEAADRFEEFEQSAD